MEWLRLQGLRHIDGKPMAQIMFFNGLCRTAARGPINSLPNEYLGDNLAFSFQLQLMANEYYPGLARRIYLKGYRYNMHLCPKSLLVEVGAADKYQGGGVQCNGTTCRYT